MSRSSVILRVVVAVAGAGLIVLALVLRASGSSQLSDFVLIFEGLLIIGGIIFERQRYRAKVHKNIGTWTPTGEKFQDPTTGHIMAVVYNEETGERDYVEV